ncbi:hypothetical protein WJX84_010429 [Apatococcus fuscideae]|uniref:Uncharacterized protein n=1 Tax=Apatococcus fuscideae TaxID=2026836 RepID=A0AAW1T1J0_9CHLO
MTDSTSVALLSTFLHIIAWSFILRVFTNLLSNVYIYFVRAPKNLQKLGSWAVITGATDGIGKAYAFALTKKGISVVLVSRSEQRLQTTAEELCAKNPSSTIKTVAVDLAAIADSATGAQNNGWASLQQAVSDLDVGLLINNVGLSYDHPEFFDQLPEGDALQMIQLNVMAATKITRLVLPSMKARRRGAIVFIGSAAATVLPASPLLAVYGATKAYLDQLARSLSLENMSAGISIQNQAPLRAIRLAVRSLLVHSPSHVRSKNGIPTNAT